MGRNSSSTNLMPVAASAPEFLVHLHDPFGVGRQVVADLVAVGRPALTVVTQCVDKGHVDEFVGQEALQEASCPDLNLVRVVAVRPNLKVGPPASDGQRQTGRDG